MRTFLKKIISHNGRMYELFYWLSVGTDWMEEDSRLKKWIDDKEYHYWSKWASK